MSGFDFGQSLQGGVDKTINFIPTLVGVLVLLLVGYIVAKVVAKVVQVLLKRLQFDAAVLTAPGGGTVTRIMESPSWFVGRVVYWLIFLTFVAFALSAFNSPVLNNILSGIYSYLPNVVAAVAIFLVATAVSAGAAAFVERVMGETATSRLIGAVIPALTMSLAVFMILSQLGIAKDIVNILFTAIVGAIALGLALAFGLGGREVARGLLEQAVDSAKQNPDLSRTVKNVRKNK